MLSNNQSINLINFHTSYSTFLDSRHLNTSIHWPCSYSYIYIWSFGSEFNSHSWQGVHVLDTTLCDTVCQWLMAGQWFSPGTLDSFINKTDCHNIAEILLKVVLNTIIYLNPYSQSTKKLYGRWVVNMLGSMWVKFIGTIDFDNMIILINTLVKPLYYYIYINIYIYIVQLLIKLL